VFTDDAFFTLLLLHMSSVYKADLYIFVFALPTKKARIFIEFRFIIEYSSLRDFGP
jgi:hypothetical protein